MEKTFDFAIIGGGISGVSAVEQVLYGNNYFFKYMQLINMFSSTLLYLIVDLTETTRLDYFVNDFQFFC